MAGTYHCKRMAPGVKPSKMGQPLRQVKGTVKRKPGVVRRVAGAVKTRLKKAVGLSLTDQMPEKRRREVVKEFEQHLYNQ